MKKLVLFITLIVSLSAYAQNGVPTEGKPTLVYSLPKTEFCVEIVTEKITQQPGIFYRYSERYLATNKIITEEKVSYVLKSIKVKTRAVPDANRTFSIEAGNKSVQLTKLSVNEQGILCGINNPVVPQPTAETTTLFAKETPKATTLLPLGEEYMMAGSEAKLAEGAAKQIYRIRESRLGLLTADVDKLPADGASLNAMLDGLCKQERELTELFVGKTTTQQSTESVSLIPEGEINNQVLFRFSTLRGLVASDDLSGAPYYINLKLMPVQATAAGSKAKADKADKPGLFYVLPATAQVSITDGVATNFSNHFFVPQLGKVVFLSEKLFEQQRIKVQIDPQTGRLLSIE